MTASDPTRLDEQRRKEKTADTSAATRKPESTLSRISKRWKKRWTTKRDKDIPDVNSNDPMSKALDEIRATRANVGDALEKMVKLHEEMKAIYTRTEGLVDDIKVPNCVTVSFLM
uniref:Coiled-coil domain-containing protein 52 n=1 Tax=Steinernema glaseri TaxID=37863 RepID=A0A1I8A7Y6_9BILA